MTDLSDKHSHILNVILDSLEVPDHLYRKAAARYQSVGEWLHREGSSVADLDPKVFPQGSFRYGTVIKPVTHDGEYDLDMACQVNLSKSLCTQEQVKNLLGEEILAYARAQNFKERPESKHRCWRLKYADGVSFHLDIVPCVPESPEARMVLEGRGVPLKWADLAVAITDDREQNFKVIDTDWPSSNPEGFAKWFVDRMKRVGPERLQKVAMDRKVASIDAVPEYEWKMPLQSAIQLLKRHRDMFFKHQEELKPVSVLITTLAAQAYQGEVDVLQAVNGILERMPGLVNRAAPRVPNPLNPREDFADKWERDHRLEEHFLLWVGRARIDLATLGSDLDDLAMKDLLALGFGIGLDDTLRKWLVDAGWKAGSGSTKIPAAPAIHIREAAKPWARGK